MASAGSPKNERNAIIYATVCRIPCGCVATYAQVARLSGLGRMARQVGYAFNSLPGDSEVPWHRVVNAKGEISARSPTGRESESIQRLRLADQVWALACESVIRAFVAWPLFSKTARQQSAMIRSTSSGTCLYVI